MSIINLYNGNMNLEITIKKLGLVYKFRVGQATGNEHTFSFGLINTLLHVSVNLLRFLIISQKLTLSIIFFP